MPIQVYPFLYVSWDEDFYIDFIDKSQTFFLVRKISHGSKSPSD